MYFCTEHACTEIDIYVPKWTVPIFCMYRKWLYRYWLSMYQNWMYRRNMYRKCMYRNCPVPKATYPVVRGHRRLALTAFGVSVSPPKLVSR